MISLIILRAAFERFDDNFRENGSKKHPRAIVVLSGGRACLSVASVVLDSPVALFTSAKALKVRTKQGRPRGLQMKEMTKNAGRRAPLPPGLLGDGVPCEIGDTFCLPFTLF